MSTYLQRSGLECDACENELKPPYIVCAVCNSNICTECFSKGAEFAEHENNHDYSIFNDSIVLFKDCKWSAKEELTLLDGLLENQNFTLIKRNLPQYSEKQIKDHYDYYYLQGNGHDLLPTFSNAFEPKPELKWNPHLITLNNIEDPPRYPPNSIGYQTVSGYNPFRGDFEIDYDGASEEVLNNLSYRPNPEDPDYEIITELQCAIVRGYNRRLKERQRRKEIIKNHGLICLRKLYTWLHRYDATVTNKVYEQLVRFAKFYTGDGFEKLMEGLHCGGELKAKIASYCHYHTKGIKTKRSIQLYLKLKALHESSVKNVKEFRNLLQFDNKNILLNEMLPVKKRGGYSPLDIEGLPGYEKLTTKEQDLCRNVRLIPISYLEFRDMLVNEYRKNGHVRLQTARKLLKIDVNKTRRLYDFLIQEGYINIKK